jgi:sulfate permease, SulP family
MENCWFEPVVGLHAALVAMIIYARYGSSRQFIVGPESTTAILIATAVAAVAGATSRLIPKI